MTKQPSRCFAIVPAAGNSRRMGQPKLLLPWGDGLIIDQVLGAWTRSEVDEVVVVVRKKDDALLDACRRWPVLTVQPEDDPSDMKASIQIALRQIEKLWQPTNHDRCFIAPADLPTLSAKVINKLVATQPSESCFDSTVVTPEFNGKQGHPVLLPWLLTRKIFTLTKNEGIDQIVQSQPGMSVVFPACDAVPDMDTPADYRQLKDQWKNE